MTNDQLTEVADAADVVAQALTSRDAAITDAHANGSSLRRIAAAANISHQTVQNIIDRNA